MALTITDYFRTVNPNIGLVVNPDGSFRIGVEDVNSDEILAAIVGGAPLTYSAPATANAGVATAELAAELNVSMGDKMIYDHLFLHMSGIADNTIGYIDRVQFILRTES